MSWLPDDVREASGGEVIDHVSHDVLKLAHRVLDRFPDMKKRHMFIAGGAAISSALIVGASVAIVRRLRSGQAPDEAVNEVTEEELDGIKLLASEREARLQQKNGAKEAEDGAEPTSAGASARTE